MVIRLVNLYSILYSFSLNTADFTKRTYLKKAPKSGICTLGIDIGGTNTRLAMASVDEGMVRLLFSLTYKSQNLRGLNTPIKSCIEFAKKDYGIKPSSICIAASGPVEKGGSFCQPTKTKWSVDAKKIEKASKVPVVCIINDFSAVSFGIRHLKAKDLRCIKKGKAVVGGPVIAIGPGTGLGKNLMLNDTTIESEGAYCDFPATDELDWELVRYVRKMDGIRHPSFERIVSGRGIETIYMFLKGMQKREDNMGEKILCADDMAKAISENRLEGPLCRETFNLFTKYLARCARNYAIDTLSTGGVYIAGGICPKNPGIFNKGFGVEFTCSTKHREILERMPVHLVLNYDVSLYGACYKAYMKLNEKV